MRKNVKRKGIDRAIVGTLEGGDVERNPPGGVGCVASKGLAGGVFGSVAMIGVSRHFFGSVASKGLRGALNLKGTNRVKCTATKCCGRTGQQSGRKCDRDIRIAPKKQNHYTTVLIFIKVNISCVFAGKYGWQRQAMKQGGKEKAGEGRCGMGAWDLYLVMQRESKLEIMARISASP